MLTLLVPAQRARRACCTGLLSLLAAAAGCTDRGVAYIPDEPNCSGCQILVERVAVVGDSTVNNSLTGRPTGVWTDRQGRYWINVLDAFPMLADAQGKLRPFAPEGDGPGEYRHPDFRAALPGDSMLITNRADFRVVAGDLTIGRSLRSWRDLEVIAVLQWPSVVFGITTPHDRATGATRTVIASLDFSGDTIALRDTILDTGPNSGRGAEWANSFRIFGRPTPGGDIWVSDYNHYRLTLYTANGQALDSLRRRPKWFPGGEPLRIGGPDEPPPPHMIGNWVDDQGLLWTLAAQPRQDAQKAWEGVSLPGKGGGGEVRVSTLPAAYELHRTVIEVLDTAAKRVIARHTFDGYIIAILPDQRVASYVETESGVPLLSIHRLTLHRSQ